MKFVKLFVLSFILLGSAFVFGCTEQTLEAESVIDNSEVEEVSTTGATIYTCPLDNSRITYNCETDSDCKQIVCKGGAGEVRTCVGDATDYEGVDSDKCICKVTGEYEVSNNEGVTETQEIKECRHI